MNPKTYTWTGISALEQRYPIIQAISGQSVAKALVNYDLIIFGGDDVLLEGAASRQPYLSKPDDLQPAVEHWFRSIKWACPEQSPYLALISNSDSRALDSQTPNQAQDSRQMFISTLVDGIHTPVLVLVNPGKDQACPERKLNPGLLLKAMKTYGVSCARTLYVGDLETDSESGCNIMVDRCRLQDLFRALRRNAA